MYSLLVNGDEVWKCDFLNDVKAKPIYRQLGFTRDPQGSDLFPAIVATGLGRDGWELVTDYENVTWFKRPLR